MKGDGVTGIDGVVGGGGGGGGGIGTEGVAEGDDGGGGGGIGTEGVAEGDDVAGIERIVEGAGVSLVRPGTFWQEIRVTIVTKVNDNRKATAIKLSLISFSKRKNISWIRLIATIS